MFRISIEELAQKLGKTEEYIRFLVGPEMEDYDGLEVGSMINLRYFHRWAVNPVKVVGFLSDGRVIIESQFPETSKAAQELGLPDGQLVISRYNIDKIIKNNNEVIGV